MSQSNINSLVEALKFSPDNIPLKLHLAEILFQANRIDEAELHFNELMQLTNDYKVKFKFAQLQFKKGAYSVCIVILEDIIQHTPKDKENLLLLTRALVEENSISKAVEIYKQIHEIDPLFTDEKLDNILKIKQDLHEDLYSEDEDEEEDLFLEKPTIDFKDVGGMENIKKEIEMKIIKPLEHQELYKAYGKKIGGGILLYGPPGCGKTFIAKATAGQINSKFISVGLNDILDMWIGNSEKNLHGVFELARRNKPCVLFFDEIDALGTSRSEMKNSGSKQLINQFLLELDGINNDNEGVLILGATNSPWDLDHAFRRPGRFDRIVFVPTPDEGAIISILKLKLKNKPIDTIDYELLAKKLEKYSGADIEAVIDIAIEEKLEKSFETGIPEPISTKDLLNASKKHKPSTSEWFNTAKNYALFANESGLYDDVLNYLNIKK